MAKTGAVDGCDPALTEAELKKELQRAARVIISEDEVNVGAIDEALQALCSLRHLKTKHHRSSFAEPKAPSLPDEFRCPLSNELMKDPVIVASGQTYERSFIQKWLKSGNRTCPRTQQVLSHTILTPNLLVQDMISRWCNINGIHLPDHVDQEGLTEADRNHFNSLLERMSSSLPDKKEAARELRMLTKRVPSFRALFGQYENSIAQLISPLCESESLDDVQVELHEDIVTTLLNISIHDDNKKLVAETPMVIPLLMQTLQLGTIEARSNAAAALFTLSALDSNKTLIGKSGALKHLISLLEEGHPLAMKDAASAIFSLCILHENKIRAVRDGAVSVLLEKIVNRVNIDELLAILAMLSTNQKAVVEMGELDAVPLLLGLMRETPCARNKENCVAVLYTICFSDRTKWKEMREEENKYGIISQLAENGTSRARRKASSILDRLNRAFNITHSA
ncbi:unnamed protein product [Cuscuta campestris]|uniref:RING-type E3 ubiquitin transferase n=1 Tax=Cuscuta campestris TaxID=132261 RepID=A0A484L0U7_9ASTE|nr:unnamed protein product [Cuscuta campestris]